MIVLGLTGSIASGKSTVLQMFADAGVPALSADQIVHALYESPFAAQVERSFPGTVVDGKVDRSRLFSHMAKFPMASEELAELVHPVVRERMLAYVESRRKRGERLIVLEIPLLFETRGEYPIDKVVVTWADPVVLRKRALARAGATPDRYDFLVSRHLPQDEKRARADFAIDTGQPLETVRKQVHEIIEACLAADRG